MNIAIILAGGTGTRIGAQVPKQFIEVMGKPIIAYTLEKYQNSKSIDAIEVVCIKNYQNKLSNIIKTFGFDKVKWIADGGDTFQESTMNGLFNMKGQIDTKDIVLITFAVSPMVTDEIIEDAIKVCKKHGNAIPADEIIMCTCIKDDEGSSSTSILRETLVGLNGPQAFRFGEICQAYESAISKGYLNNIDPHTTSLYFYQGRRLWFSKSATNNIKITRKEDLDVFEGSLLLAQKRKQTIK